MRNFLNGYLLIILCLALFSEPSRGYGIEIRLRDGTLIKGELQQETLKVKTESGVVDVKIEDIAEISQEEIDTTAPSDQILRKGLNLWIQSAIKFYDEKQNKALPLLGVESYKIRKKTKRALSPELLPDEGPLSFLKRLRSPRSGEDTEKKEPPQEVFIYEFALEALTFKVIRDKPSGWAVFQIYQEKTARGLQPVSIPHEKLTKMELKEGDRIPTSEMLSGGASSLDDPVRLAFILEKEGWVLRKADADHRLGAEKWTIQ